MGCLRPCTRAPTCVSLPRQYDLREVRLTSGAQRGLASSRPEPHVLLGTNERGGQPWVSLARRSSLSANMSETATPRKFSVEGEQGLEDDERTGTSPRWTGDRGDGEGDPTAVYGGVQTEDRPGGRRV